MSGSQHNKQLSHVICADHARRVIGSCAYGDRLGSGGSDRISLSTVSGYTRGLPDRIALPAFLLEISIEGAQAPRRMWARSPTHKAHPDFG